MSDLIKPNHTRFRAYQLGQAGSSFSYFDGTRFTLIEGMGTDLSKPALLHELEQCGKRTIDTLHITSWDSDHCSESGLQWILETLQPTKIEYPGYIPHTDCARSNLATIQAHQKKMNGTPRAATLVKVDPPYLKGLKIAEGLGYKDIVYHPKTLSERSNDNSIVKLFRTGMFNVASLGDIECSNIGSMLRSCKIMRNEVDVMILAHHGADSGITTKKFLSHIDPSVAICTSNYDNQYSHPAQNIRDLLVEHRIPLYTTKTGDVVVKSIGSHRTEYQVVNLKANSTEVSSTRVFVSKKANLLSGHQDSVRNRYQPGFKGVKR